MGNKSSSSVEYYPGLEGSSHSNKTVDKKRKKNKDKKNKIYNIPSNATRPSPPSKPTAVIESNGIFLYWKESSSGGCPIIGYQVQYISSKNPTWTSSSLTSTSPECLIQNLVPGVTYVFRVLAENILGLSAPSPETEQIVFSNEPMEPKFIVGLKDVYYGIIYEKITFRVQLSPQVHPTPYLNWYLNDDQLIEEFNENIEIEPGQLVIKRITEDMEGELRCVAINEIGTAETHGNLVVGLPPKIIETHRENSPENSSSKYSEYSIDCQHLLFQVGEMARIRFKFSGKPEPTVTWYHDGNELRNMNTAEWTIETLPGLTILKIHSVARSNRGEYSVKLENSFGIDSGFVLITIGDVPSPPRQPTVLVLKDNSVVLEWDDGVDDGGCHLGSYTVEYFRSGWDVWLTGFRTKNCTIKSGRIRDLIPGSKYKFRVKSENPYGVSEPSLESVEILIPDYNKESGELMSPLEEEIGEESGAMTSATGNEFQIEEIGNYRKKEDKLKIEAAKPEIFRRRSKERIQNKSPSPLPKRQHFDSVPVVKSEDPLSAKSRNLSTTKHFSPIDPTILTESSKATTSTSAHLFPSTYETYSSPRTAQFLSKPWNPPKKDKDNNNKFSSTHSLPRTSIPNNLSPQSLAKRPASSLETISPNLIYEGSSHSSFLDNDSSEYDFSFRDRDDSSDDDEEESSITVTTSFLTVLKTGSIKTASSSRTASKEELRGKSSRSSVSGGDRDRESPCISESNLQVQEQEDREAEPDAETKPNIEAETEDADYFSKIFGNKRSFVCTSTSTQSPDDYEWFHTSKSNSFGRTKDAENKNAKDLDKEVHDYDYDDNSGIRVFPSNSLSESDDENAEIGIEDENSNFQSESPTKINRKFFAASVLLTGILLKYPLYTSYGIMVYVTYRLGKVLFWDKEEELNSYY